MAEYLSASVSPVRLRRIRRSLNDQRRWKSALEPRTESGGVAEWLKATVLKTVRPLKGLVGSNPTASALVRGTFLSNTALGRDTPFP